MDKRVVVAAALGLLVAGAGDARAFNAQPDPPGRFALVGLAAGQMMRLSAVRVDNPDFVDNPDYQPVSLKLMFVDGNGHVVVTRDGVRLESTVLLRPGQSGFLDLDSRAIIDGGAGRVMIRAVIVPAPRAPNQRSSDPEWLPGLELFDIETGKSSVVLQPGSDRYFKEVEPGQPQP